MNIQRSLTVVNSVASNQEQAITHFEFVSGIKYDIYTHSKSYLYILNVNAEHFYKLTFAKFDIGFRCNSRLLDYYIKFISIPTVHGKLNALP